MCEENQNDHDTDTHISIPTTYQKKPQATNTKCNNSLFPNKHNPQLSFPLVLHLPSCIIYNSRGESAGGSGVGSERWKN